MEGLFTGEGGRVSEKSKLSCQNKNIFGIREGILSVIIDDSNTQFILCQY